MEDAMITIQAVGFKELQRGLQNIIVNKPTWQTQQLQELGIQLQKLVLEEIQCGAEPFIWHGDLYSSVDVQTVSTNEVAVVQSEEGLFILYGTEGRPNAKGAPEGLIDWCESKLGLDGGKAWIVARTIFRHGILAESRQHYPSGNKGFNYAQRVVEETGKDTINQYAIKMGNLAIRYLNTGI
jgi:hypothetical protein